MRETDIEREREGGRERQREREIENDGDRGKYRKIDRYKNGKRKTGMRIS